MLLCDIERTYAGERIELHSDVAHDAPSCLRNSTAVAMERGYGNRLASSDILAKGGYSKQDVAKCLMKNAMVPARYFEWNMTVGDHHPPGTILSDLVEKGVLPREWCLSADADRLVPLMLPATEWLVVVTGDPMRNRSCIYRENFKQGYATSKKLKLPPNWDALMGGLQPLRKNS